MDMSRRQHCKPKLQQMKRFGESVQTIQGISCSVKAEHRVKYRSRSGQNRLDHVQYSKQEQL